MRLDVLNINGEKTGRTVELPSNVFGIEPNEHAVYLAIKLYLANQRQGTHKSKERSEISGSTRKLHKQKGTGGSRKGDINSPLFPGGGRVFGPRPRDYSFSLNKKVRALARKSVLSVKASEGKIMVVEDIKLDTPKTKQYIKILSNLNASKVRSIVLVGEDSSNVYLSSRNVQKTKVSLAQGASTYDLLNAQAIIISESALSAFQSSND
ncbi:MAG: 50S ribosomal protein L4 [Saprospiraceae bacterium]|nr:50S ribosomal protein L4 [Saprospiraceae bacterium]